MGIEICLPRWCERKFSGSSYLHVQTDLEFGLAMKNLRYMNTAAVHVEQMFVKCFLQNPTTNMKLAPFVPIRGFL